MTKLAFLVINLLSILALADAPPMTIPVDSPAVLFSPGNWTARAGKVFRQTWNPGAYFRVTWESTNPKPLATILLDTSTFTPGLNPPLITYNIDGVWKSQIPCAKEIKLDNLTQPGKHELTVFLRGSEQKERWGSEGKSGANVLRFTGLQVDADSKPLPIATASKWALILGDSITEGIGAGELAGYAHLVGQALQTQGYEYGISACGWSGWICKGDNPPGDVPAYYLINAGKYDEAASRWNKVDGNNHSLLDSQNHISAYGQSGQEPSLIMINYGTNDILRNSNPADTLTSMTQALAALRKSAPLAQITVIIPFGQYNAKELYQAVAAHRQTHPTDIRINIIDLGPSVAKTLNAPDGLMGGLHPNDKGHALFAAKIIPQLLLTLPAPTQP